MSPSVTLVVTTPADVTPEQLSLYMREQMERTSEASDLPGDVWDLLDQAEIVVSAVPPHPLPPMSTRCRKCGGAEFPGGAGCICDHIAKKALELRVQELEAQLCGQLVEHPGRKAMLLVLAELRRAKATYPHFACDLDQALTVLLAEVGELAAAILKNDIEGEHGVIREAAQVGAVALRIIEMACYIVEHRASLKALREDMGPCTCGVCMACQDSGLGR